MIGELVARLIAAGTPADVAAAVVAEAFAAGVIARPREIDPRSSGAKRQARYRERNETSQNVTVLRDNEGDEEASQTVTDRNETSQSDAFAKVPLSRNIKKVRERQNRGTRIALDWSPSDAERAFAKQEGFSDWEIQRETQKFRDYWTACAGAKGVKLDWTATWRQWIRNGAERAGKTPAPTSGAAASTTGYYAKAESEQLAAWDAHSVRIRGKSLPRDRNGGWHVQSEWPPEPDLPFESREAAE